VTEDPMAGQVRCLHIAERSGLPLTYCSESSDGLVHPDCLLAHYREAGKVLVDEVAFMNGLNRLDLPDTQHRWILSLLTSKESARG